MSITITLTTEQLASIAAQQGGAAPAAVDASPPQAPPGYVYMPITRHVLPLPQAEQTSFWGYLMAAWQAAGGEVGQQSPMRASVALRMQAEAEGRAIETLGRDSWPEAVDRLYNDAYLTPEQLAQRRAAEDAAAAGVWISGGGGSAANTPAPVPVQDASETI